MNKEKKEYITERIIFSSRIELHMSKKKQKSSTTQSSEKGNLFENKGKDQMKGKTKKTKQKANRR
ncbi:MAG: hypothetical protein GPJ54_02620 [Candidatus Heimdallarchaeota archaeon]|nr:hypothetical protein [Candidatus Heimdallarchaeota archaeon]